jgi:Tol biopolymer transport system component
MNLISRPMLFLLLMLCLCTTIPSAVAQDSDYPLCSEQPITSRERIVFNSLTDTVDAGNIYVTDPQTDDTCLLLETTHAEGLEWSPDGSMIAFSRWLGDLHMPGYIEYSYVITADGLRLTANTQLGMGANGVTWSPDGALIAYRSASEDVGYVPVVIQEGFEGKVVSQYTPLDAAEPIPNGEPEWSPDGESVAFPAITVVLENSILSDIYGLNTGGELRWLAGTLETFDYAPTWSPDGSYIAFTSELDDVRQLMLVNLETREVRESVLEIASYGHVWLPDGRLAFTTEDEDGVHLYVTDVSMTGDWTTVERVPLPFDVVQFDWWIDPATLSISESP